jgi:hypothetical protein
MGPPSKSGEFMENIPFCISFLFSSFYSVVARNNDILKKLVLEAKREYEKDAEHRVHIFLADMWVIYVLSIGEKKPIDIS